MTHDFPILKEEKGTENLRFPQFWWWAGAGEGISGMRQALSNDENLIHHLERVCDRLGIFTNLKLSAMASHALPIQSGEKWERQADEAAVEAE
ncbi:uncharacterized protein RAG0_01119 [Rhynchosporium agropyri]|uniref:Uncharacterized protein n=1 Tax=Rhynchosporium agropyri TaxID=914238 RepID=A0A1E1JVL4_9HELO|nr:uncharacterized protein RAG0_01119 [Rhynchosporium agropyri]